MKRTLHINNYTVEEVQATWYTDDEMNSIREKINRTVQLMAAGENKKHHCTRGLECCSSRELRQQKLDNKMAGKYAVLDEQDRQDGVGIIDCEQIARVYQAVSSHCQVAASLMGAADEKAVAHRCLSSRRKHSSSKSPIVTRQQTVQKLRAM